MAHLPQSAPSPYICSTTSMPDSPIRTPPPAGSIAAPLPFSTVRSWGFWCSGQIWWATVDVEAIRVDLREFDSKLSPDGNSEPLQRIKRHGRVVGVEQPI
jgi:hypothetical protein